MGALLAGTVSLIASRAGALTPKGAVAATLLGTFIYAGTGFRGSAALVTYFASSTLLGRLRPAASRPQRRGNQRDAVQVMANGGVPALFAAAAVRSSGRTRLLLVAGFSGAVAAATADTWSTEIGTRFGGTPRSITTLRPLATGASGGVSAAGLAAATAGSLLTAWIASARSTPRQNGMATEARFWPIVLGGVAGSLTDSALGASIQEVRFCSSCSEETELAIHACGAASHYLRGQRWCDNDTVNTLSIALGALVTIGSASLVNRSRTNANVPANAVRALIPTGHGECH